MQFYSEYMYYTTERTNCLSSHIQEASNIYVDCVQIYWKKNFEDSAIHTAYVGYCRSFPSTLQAYRIYVQQLKTGKTRVVFSIKEADAATIFVTSFVNVTSNITFTKLLGKLNRATMQSV